MPENNFYPLISVEPPSVLLSVTDLKGGGSGGACTERSCNEPNGPGDDDNVYIWPFGPA